MQALGPDSLETVTPEEVEETIDYILNEVLSSSAVTTDHSLTSRIENSIGRIL